VIGIKAYKQICGRLKIETVESRHARRGGEGRGEKNGDDFDVPLPLHTLFKFFFLDNYSPLCNLFKLFLLMILATHGRCSPSKANS
jgi:hypothetical protein